MIRKILAALGVMCALSFNIAQAQDSLLKEIIEGGVLKVGVTGDWNPMTIKNPADNTYKGFDIDVTTELAKDLGVKVEFVPTDWKTLVAGVTSGKYHITGSASKSAKRAKVAGYSSSYADVGQLPLILKKNASKMRKNVKFGK